MLYIRHTSAYSFAMRRTIFAGMLALVFIGVCQKSFASGADCGISNYEGDLPLTSRALFPAVYTDSTRPLVISKGGSLTAVGYFFHAYVDTPATAYFEGIFTDKQNKTWTITSDTQNVLVPHSGQTYASFALKGFPASVSLGRLTGHIVCSAVKDYTDRINDLYITNSAPVGVQSPVWEEIVRKTCNACFGDSTVSDCAMHCTTGLYLSGEIIYTSNLPKYYFVQDSTFDLKQYLVDLSSGKVTCDCRDTSSMLQIWMNSQGVGASMEEMYAPLNSKGQIQKFVTNRICPIGGNPAVDSQYGNSSWNFHQFTTVSGRAYDACTAFLVDLGGNLYRKSATSWDMLGYWQTAFGPNQGGVAYTGLVSGLVSQDPCRVVPNEQGPSLITVK